MCSWSSSQSRAAYLRQASSSGVRTLSSAHTAFSSFRCTRRHWLPEKHVRGAPRGLNDNSTTESNAPEELVTKAPKSDRTPATAATGLPFPVRRPRLKKQRLAILFAALLSVMALLVFLRVLTASRNPALGLQIEPDGSDFRVSWNRASSLIGKARNGRLVIRDGNQQERSLVLDGPMLRTGTIVYSPASTSGSLNFNSRSLDQMARRQLNR